MLAPSWKVILVRDHSRTVRRRPWCKEESPGGIVVSDLPSAMLCWKYLQPGTLHLGGNPWPLGLSMEVALDFFSIRVRPDVPEG